jgi:hypothetical protein
VMLAVEIKIRFREELWGGKAGCRIPRTRNAKAPP